MEIFTTEIFGPVLACYKFDNMEEVIERANNTEYGLQSYVYSNDISIAQNVATRLDFGMVSVNDSMPSANITGPFSGRKNSGFDIESSDEAIYEYLNSKYLNIRF